jgi:hypothetical protein
VYTNDDLETRPAQTERPASGDVDPYAALLTCGVSCEQQARTEVALGGHGVSDEAAWKKQIRIARKRLAADSAWREELWKMIELMQIYCNDINPQSRKGSPDAESYDAGTAAAAREYVQLTGRSLDESFQLQATQLRATVNEVRLSDPATGALMNVEANRILECSLYVP